MPKLLWKQISHRSDERNEKYEKSQCRKDFGTITRTTTRTANPICTVSSIVNGDEGHEDQAIGLETGKSAEIVERFTGIDGHTSLVQAASDHDEVIGVELGECAKSECAKSVESFPRKGRDASLVQATATGVQSSTVLPAFFISFGCGRSIIVMLALYSAALAVATVIAHVQLHSGLILLSLLPAVFMMTYAQRLFARSVLRREMVLTFFLAILCMSPVVVVENLWYYVVLTKSHLDDAGDVPHSTGAISWAYRFLSAFVRAFLVAALFEEGAKFLALRRLRSLPHVNDPRAMVTYGICAGVALGTVENLFLYAFAYGIDVTLIRAILTVPMHGMTGMLTACALAEDVFLVPAPVFPAPASTVYRPWYRIIAAPVLFHGMFDFLDFFFPDRLQSLLIAVEASIVVTGFVYFRWKFLRLVKAVPVEDDIHCALRKEAESLDRTALEDVFVEETGAVDGVESTMREKAWEQEAEERNRVGLWGRLTGEGSTMGPSNRYVGAVVGTACVFCTGMLLFLYFSPV